MLRRRTPEAELPVKMWGFLVLTLLTIAAMVAVLISMGIAAHTRSQLVLSLVSLAVVLLVYVAGAAAHPGRGRQDRAGARGLTSGAVFGRRAGSCA